MNQFFYWLNSLVGIANLAFYAWGPQDPKSLAVGIACLFVATWANQESR
jgi:hypothetical protein